jgi:hypothetical protein
MREGVTNRRRNSGFLRGEFRACREKPRILARAGMTAYQSTQGIAQGTASNEETE